MGNDIYIRVTMIRVGVSGFPTYYCKRMCSNSEHFTFVGIDGEIQQFNWCDVCSLAIYPVTKKEMELCTI